jgi:cell division protein FtsI/penicillin-binding protein 2
MQNGDTNPHTKAILKRINFYSRTIFVIMTIVVIRAFDLQIIQHAHYVQAAQAAQLEEYQIPAERGLIEANEGGTIVPIVLNQELYTLYGDPPLVKNAAQAGQKIAEVIGGNADTYEQKLTAKNTEYVVLAKKITQAQSSKILSYQLPGINTQGQGYRTYPDGSLASQVLGFVNNSSTGEYGIEQALNKELAGTPGKVKAVTDIHGVPLAASANNVDIQPKNGSNVVLTLNLGMQYQVEQILQSEYTATKSQGLSALVMDPNTGQIVAMANYPTYNPADYGNVTDPTLFENAVVDNAIEPGSSMKTLTTSAALDIGAIQPNESFYDPAHWIVNGFNITDIEQDGGPREQNIASILALSLNTGATWMLMQMSNPGGTQIGPKGIETWYNYMVNHFRLGQVTGIEQGYEDPGYVPTDNLSNPSIDLTYANTAFGQGVTVTAIQMGAALSSILNGGTYYKPTLVAETIAPNGAVTVNQPKVEEKNVVSPKVGQELIPLMQNVVTTYLHEGFSFMNFPSN